MDYLLYLLSVVTCCSITAVNTVFLYYIYYYIRPLLKKLDTNQTSELFNPLTALNLLKKLPFGGSSLFSPDTTSNTNNTSGEGGKPLFFVDSPNVQMDKLNEIFRDLPLPQPKHQPSTPEYTSTMTQVDGGEPTTIDRPSFETIVGNTTRDSSLLQNTHNVKAPEDLRFLLDQASLLVEKVQHIGANGAKGVRRRKP